MSNILDRTQESLADAFASLAANARRQQRLYFATIAALIAIVAVSVALLATLAIDRQLDVQRRISAQNAADISLFLHRCVSFLIRSESTVRFYRETRDVHDAPDDVLRQIRESGVAMGRSATLGVPLNVVVSATTRNAWGADLSAQLWRVTEAAESTFATREAFGLPYQALLIGLDGDYAAILQARGPRSNRDAPALTSQLAASLRESTLAALAAQTGKRTLAAGERVLVGPYTDPLLGVPVVTALSMQSVDGQPAMLIAMTIDVSAMLAGLDQPPHSATLLLGESGNRSIASKPALAPSTIQSLSDIARSTPAGGIRYTWRGAVLVDAVTPGHGLLVSDVPWRAVIAAAALQLVAIVGLGLLILVAMALTAKFWGMRLLRDWHDEARRALESETINHIVVSATPVGLCIVRQQDFSVVASNQLARDLMRLGDATHLPPHIAAAYTEHSLRAIASASGAASVASDSASTSVSTASTASTAPVQRSVPSVDAEVTLEGNHAEFIVAALPKQADATNAADTADAAMLQINYESARHDNEDVLFCAILDISARYALGRQLRAAQRETQALMRAQSNFFAAMSHEIRTPMNALLGNLELLSTSPGLEQHEPRVRAVGMAADGLRRIVNDILDFSKIDAGMMKLVSEPFNPLDDLESLALSYAPLVGKRPLHFYAYLSPALDRVRQGDSTRVVQIVNNLLSNAFKFTSSGKVTLSAHRHADEAGPDMLVCRVGDSGIGMDAQQVARIFKPFVQAEPGTASRFGGTGLGLSICVRLCELMGGKITVESVQGVGSAFTVSLPFAASASAGHAEGVVPTGAASGAEPATRGSAFVLCQELAGAKWFDEVLALQGWQATCVTSLDAARNWLRVNQPTFMIVTGEYDEDAIAQLRACRSANVVWMTLAGPPGAAARGDGVWEVTAFSQRALSAAIERAVNDEQHDEVLDDDAYGNVQADAPLHAQHPLAAARIAQAHASHAPSDPLEQRSFATASDAQAAKPSALAGLRVLVAEDNPLNQALVTDQLTMLGCAPIVVGDGKQALAVLSQTDVDLVLTDIHMPEMDGYALMAALRDAHPALPVIAFSAVTGAEQAQEWRQRGFAGYIPKPASLQQMRMGLLALQEGAAISQPQQHHAADEPHPPATLDEPHTLDTVDKSRYLAMLKDHLSTDLPRLAGIVDACDCPALRDWAHSAGGAFLIVHEPQFADRCRELQRMCDAARTWTPAIAHYALALHDTLRSHFGLDEPSLH
jgi:two-component system, NarL family, capsular synthesis sensor histidine kinase RcsC